MSEEKQLYGADLVVDSLINHDVEYVFGIPGAKIDRVFDTLEDKGPELIVARHEQNAAFMAQGVGRITGKPGEIGNIWSRCLQFGYWFGNSDG